MAEQQTATGNKEGRRVVNVRLPGEKQAQPIDVPYDMTTPEIEAKTGGIVIWGMDAPDKKGMQDAMGAVTPRNVARAGVQGLYGVGDEYMAARRSMPAGTAGGAFAIPPVQLVNPDLSPRQDQMAPFGQELQQERASLKAFEDQNPLVAYPLEFIPGAMAPGSTAGALPQAARPAARWGAKWLAEPMAAGGLTGLGMSESGTSGGILQDVGTGMVAATGLQGLLGGMTNVLGPAMRELLNFTVRTDENVAIAQLRKAMIDDGVSPDDATRLIQEIGAGGSLADIGPNLRQVFDDALMRRGSARARADEMLRRRLDARENRVREGVLESNDLRIEDFWNVVDSLDAQRKGIGRELYEEAYSYEIPPDRALDDMLDLPRMQDFLQQANADLRGYGINAPQGMRLYDNTKRMMDDEISRLYRNGQSNQAGQLRDLRNRFVERLDELTELRPGDSAYRRARSAYAGTKQAEEALWLGYDALRKTRSEEQLLREVAKLGDHEREMVRLGIFRSLIDDIVDNGNTSTVANRIMNNPRKRKIIAQAFRGGDQGEGFASLMQTLMQSMRQSDLTRLLTQSLTAPRMMSAQKGAGNAFGQAVSEGTRTAAVSGSSSAGILSGLLRGLTNLRGEISDEAMDVIAREMSQELSEEQIVRILQSGAKMIEPGALDPAVQRAIAAGRIPAFRMGDLGEEESL